MQSKAATPAQVKLDHRASAELEALALAGTKPAPELEPPAERRPPSPTQRARARAERQSSSPPRSGGEHGEQPRRGAEPRGGWAGASTRPRSPGDGGAVTYSDPGQLECPHGGSWLVRSDCRAIAKRSSDRLTITKRRPRR